MEKKDIVLIIIGLFLFIYCLYRNERKILLLAIFFLPVGILFDSKLIPIGLSGVLILAVWFSMKIKQGYTPQKMINWRNISKKIVWLYFFLFFGFLLGLLIDNKIDTYTKQGQYLQLYRHSSHLVIVILFIKILINYRNDFDFQKKMALVFMTSIFLNLLPIIADRLGIFNTYFTTSYTKMNDVSTDSEISRFSGILGDYELIIDYCMIIIAFSFMGIIQKGKNKLLLGLIFVCAFALALYSGTRSFLIISVSFFLCFLLFSLRYAVYRARVIFSLILFCIISYIFLVKYSHRVAIFERFIAAREIYTSTGSLSEASNRDFNKAIVQLYENITFLGNGSLTFSQIKGNEMVSHNLLLHTYAKYGIPGIVLILYVFFKSFYLIFKRVKRIKIKAIRLEGIVLISLLAALFLQENKISALRNQNSMLIYSFLFILIYFYLYKTTSIIRTSQNRGHKMNE